MSYKWRQYNVGDKLPKKALRGGTDASGSDIYIGRAMHLGFMLPAKVIPANNGAYITYNGEEVPVHNLEILTGEHKYFTWVPASNGNVAPGSMATGPYQNEQIYIGRATYFGSMIIGKIHPSHGVLYIGYNKCEISFAHYEVLVYSRYKKKKKKESSSSSSSSSSSDSDRERKKKKNRNAPNMNSGHAAPPNAPMNVPTNVGMNVGTEKGDQKEDQKRDPKGDPMGDQPPPYEAIVPSKSNYVPEKK